MLFKVFLLLAAFAPAAGASYQKERHRLPGGIELTVKFPRGPRGPLPAVLLFGGFQTGEKVLDLVHPPVPLLVATFEYPVSFPRKLRFPSALKFLPEARRALHQSLKGMEELVDWAGRHPLVDPERIVLVGASFGAPFVSVAGKHPSVKGLILAHGFADVPGTIAAGLARKWEPRWGALGSGGAWILAHLLWWVSGAPDPESALSSYGKGKEVLLLSAENDEILPPASVEALRESLRESGARWEERKFSGGHLRPTKAEAVTELLGAALAWMKERGLLAH